MLPKTESPGRIVCLLGMCVAFAGIGTGHFSQYFIYLDVFSHLTIHFAIAAIALGWAYLMPRHRLFSAIALMLAGMLALGLWPDLYPRQLLPRGEVDAPSGYRELRVMSFNKWQRNKDQEAIRLQIEQQDPDIVFLAEANRNDRLMTAAMHKQFPYQYPSSVYPRGFRLQLVSRYPLRDVLLRGLWDGPVFVRASLGPAWGNLTILGTHTIRAPRVRAQWNQIQALSRYVASIPGPRLVMGDFNATPYSRMSTEMVQVTGMTQRSILPTWPADGRLLPQIAIDHMFADPSLKFPDGVIVGNKAGSDHLPILARIWVPVATDGRQKERDPAQ